MAAPARQPAYNDGYGAENLLDDFHCARTGGRLSSADLVGIGRNRTDSLLFVVGRLSQRLVLNSLAWVRNLGRRAGSSRRAQRHREACVSRGFGARTCKRPRARDRSRGKSAYVRGSDLRSGLRSCQISGEGESSAISLDVQRKTPGDFAAVADHIQVREFSGRRSWVHRKTCTRVEQLKIRKIQSAIVVDRKLGNKA